MSQYPYTLFPQVPTSSAPGPDDHGITCPPDLNARFVILNGTSLNVIKGRNTDCEISLRTFFQPVTTAYSEYNFNLPKNSGSVTLEYGMTANDDGEVLFVCLFPEYNRTSLKQPLWELEWRYSGDASYRKLGRILMLSGTENGLIPPLEIRNLTDTDIPITLLVSR